MEVTSSQLSVDITIEDLNRVINGINVECKGVECCPMGEDNGWTSCPEADLES